MVAFIAADEVDKSLGSAGLSRRWENSSPNRQNFGFQRMAFEKKVQMGFDLALLASVALVRTSIFGLQVATGEGSYRGFAFPWPNSIFPEMEEFAPDSWPMAPVIVDILWRK